MDASAFQIGTRNAATQLRRLSSSCLYSTPVQEMPVAVVAETAVDTDGNISATDFIFSEISAHDVRDVNQICVRCCVHMRLVLTSHLFLFFFSIIS